MRAFLIAATLYILGVASITAANEPKHEFRGAWLHTVFQDKYLQRTSQQNKDYLINQLDNLQLAGINAVIFQVRPSADAFYDSRHEPWSRFITTGGKAPEPFWDPLEFVIKECHARGMELHAWLNPYRVTTNAKDVLPKGHIYHKHPERFVRFDKKLYFDPGLPENRRFIADVVMDIVERYDVDGIHFDDYFYPYPVKGLRFNDDKSFKKYGKGMKLNDWRRHNVDLLIEDIHARIHKAKPWVRFGISPFGIWRNKASDARGSDTRGLQNYDDLFADVLLWVRKGWVDYLIPQLYWTLENAIASSEILAKWWGDNVKRRHVYIGQDVKTTMGSPDLSPSKDKSQLRTKIQITRDNPSLQGSCWWPGYSLTENLGGVADSLSSSLQSHIALVPPYPWISDIAPSAPSNVKIDGRKLKWVRPKKKGVPEDAVRYVVYGCAAEKKINIDSPECILAVTDSDNYPIDQFPRGYKFAVSSLSRTNIESAPSKTVTIK